MTKPTIRIHDLATDQVIDREMTDAEHSEYEAQKAKDVAASEATAQKATDKAALLDRLGISEDEAKLLLG
jgi:hypothetical protein